MEEETEVDHDDSYLDEYDTYGATRGGGGGVVRSFGESLFHLVRVCTCSVFETVISEAGAWEGG